jgi:hypothetical protein
MPNVGDRILGEWPEEAEWWYPGVVCTADGTRFGVQFDDGDRAFLGPDQLRALAIPVGTRVQARFRGGPDFFPGAVTAQAGHAVHVHYDDGDQEWASVSMLRVHRDDPPPSE